jgi:beta-lactamase regulating signal transducer with metallopeptidase domain
MLAWSLAWSLECALVAGVLLAASGLGAVMLRRGTAAARHQIWTLGVIGALALPLLSWLMPRAAAVPVIGGVSIGTPVLANAVTSATGSTWPGWCAAIWALGTVIVAARFARGHLAARRLVRGATRWPVPLRVDVLRSEAIASPMTVGVIHPRVLFPVAAEQWSADRVNAALVHELGHVERRDTVI